MLYLLFYFFAFLFSTFYFAEPSTDSFTSDESGIITPNDDDNNNNVHVIVKGFITNMGDWMAASDLIITKAGPGTIAEACTKALPVLMHCYLPGQEEGNVHFVVDNNFGEYSPKIRNIVNAACGLLLDSDKRKLASERSKAAMDAKATCRIVDDMMKLMIERAMKQQKRIQREKKKEEIEKIT